MELTVRQSAQNSMLRQNRTPWEFAQYSRFFDAFDNNIRTDWKATGTGQRNDMVPPEGILSTIIERAERSRCNQRAAS